MLLPGNLWKLKATKVSIIVGTLWMIKKGFEKYVCKIPGGLSLKKIKEWSWLIKHMSCEEHGEKASQRLLARNS